MEKEQPNFIDQQIQIAQIICGFLMAGLIIFYLFVWFLIRKSAGLFNEFFAESLLYLALPFVVLGAIIGAVYIGKYRKQKRKQHKSPEDAAVYYRETVILQTALVEGASLYAIFIAFFTISYVPLLFFAVAFLMLIYLFPGREKFLKFIEQ